MLSKNSICIALLCLTVSGLSTASGPAVCTTNASDEITYVDTGPTTDFCALSAAEMTYKLKYVGLCASAPDESNYQSRCSQLFENSAGQSVRVSGSSNLNLVDELTLTEGTYTHAFILIDNTIQFRASGRFSPIRYGKTSSGVYCWTLTGDASSTAGVSGASPRANYLAECGASLPSQYGLASSTVRALYDFANNTGFINNSSGSNASGGWSARLLDSSGLAALVALNGSSSNADQISGVQTYTTPVVISPSTKNINVKFKLTNTAGVLNHEDSSLNYIPRFGLGGFEFEVTASE